MKKFSESPILLNCFNVKNIGKRKEERNSFKIHIIFFLNPDKPDYHHLFSVSLTFLEKDIKKKK